MSSESQQLVLVKQLAEEAERQLAREDDFGNGLAVSLTQDAIELLIRIAVRTFDVDVPARATMDQMADAIGKSDEARAVPHRARIEEVNKARVGFKHSGTAPGRADAMRLVRFGVEFLEVACPRFFGIEYRDLSLAHSIRSEEVRALLLAAEKYQSEGQYREAMIEAAYAVRAVEAKLERLMPSPPAPVRSAGDNEPALRSLQQYLRGLRLLSLAALAGFDARALVGFQSMAPNVSMSAAGERSTILHGPVTYSEEQVTFAVKFAVAFAAAVQSRIG